MINKGKYVLLALLLLFLGSFSFFTVNETESVIISRFGKITKIYISEDNYKEIKSQLEKDEKFKYIKVSTNRGLHIKIPFIDTITVYDNRLLTYDISPSDVITNDKKKLTLDNFAQWQIVNPVYFKISMKNITAAHTRIDDIIYSVVREKIGLIEAEDLIGNIEKVNAMTNEILVRVNKELESNGIKIVDLKIKNIMLPVENRQNVYNRMVAERVQMAKKYRSEGEEEYLKITSEAKKQATIIEADAYEKAQKIKGEGDAEATRIYNEAYNRDVEFYKFFRTMQAYKNTIKDTTKIVVPADSEFAKYLFKIN